MRTCTNCGSQITCGCQDRVATNGVKVCASCIVTYEQQLIAQRNLDIQNAEIQASLTMDEKFTS
jgi:hypothetical protein